MKHLSLTIFSALLILSSCIREEQPGRDFESKLITFSPSVNVPVQTKAAGFESFGSTKLVDESGELTIPLSCYSTVDTSDVFSYVSQQDGIQTKGSKITSISGISSFFACAYDDKGARFIPDPEETANYKEVKLENGAWSVDESYEWIGNSVKTFFGYANISNAISILTPSSEGVHFSYNVPESASNQGDFLVGFFKGTPDYCKELTGVSCKVPMAFSHTMASISFKQSPSLKGVGKITDIEISGIYSTGTVAINESGTISWTEQSIGDSFSVSESAPSGFEPASDYSIGESFFLIPQTDGEVKITVTIKDNDTESRKVSATLKPDWQAGHSYVYTFGEGFMPEICDDTSIKNVGTEPGYLRAAVIAYVVDGSGVVIGPSTVSPATGSGWTSDGNGFYLYDSKLDPGESASEFVTNKEAIKNSGATLKILIQASTESFN